MKTVYTLDDSDLPDDDDWPDGAEPEPEPETDGDGWHDDTPTGPSKSQIKREHLALQDLAEELTRLPAGEVERLGLGEATRAALAETARIKDRRALRRHHKRIAGCLARDNTGPLVELLAMRADHARAAAARHHAVEHWRARLIDEGDGALTELFDDHPAADRQHLRTLVRAARRDVERGRPEGPRRLFRALRALLEGDAAAADSDPDADPDADPDSDADADR